MESKKIRVSHGLACIVRDGLLQVYSHWAAFVQREKKPKLMFWSDKRYLSLFSVSVDIALFIQCFHHFLFLFQIFNIFSILLKDSLLQFLYILKLILKIQTSLAGFSTDCHVSVSNLVFVAKLWKNVFRWEEKIFVNVFTSASTKKARIMLT